MSTLNLTYSAEALAPSSATYLWSRSRSVSLGCPPFSSRQQSFIDSLIHTLCIILNTLYLMRHSLTIGFQKIFLRSFFFLNFNFYIVIISCCNKIIFGSCRRISCKNNFFFSIFESILAVCFSWVAMNYYRSS